MSTPADIVCVILAGGRGKRMAAANAHQHKVCFPIAGRPAIVRAIDTYKSAGVKRFVVVVGQMAEQVISTVAAAHPETLFVYQANPRGTGHAALVGVEALAAQSHSGPVMIVMGDKLIQPEVVRQIIERFEASQADVVLATLPKSPTSTAGRVVVDAKGRVLAVVERPDVEQARKEQRQLPVADRMMTAAQIEKASPGVNASLYLFRMGPLSDAVHRLRSDNVQGELYLTDTIADLAQRGHVEAMLVPNPDDLMAYNTPEELAAIERVVSQREESRVAVGDARQTAQTLRPAQQWLEVLDENGPTWRRLAKGIYGSDAALLEERRRAMTDLIRIFAVRFGPERPMLLCRAPGRINLMGRHVDHRGGYVNVMALNREVLLAVAPRPDDVVTLSNLDARRFPDRRFRISDVLTQAGCSDWLDLVDSSVVHDLLAAAPGDWSHYAQAPLLRLQHECRGQARFQGMDCLVNGNIPMAAGLSSSSSLVVAFAEAAVALNHLDVTIRDLVDLCGEGEWFVGSRGGSADHAAIRTGRLGYVTPITFFPLRIGEPTRFPSELRLVICHSGANAAKSEGARDTFNQRVACYNIAQLLLRRRWAPAANLEHLRDLTPEHLHVSAGDIYRALLTLPASPSRRELRKLLPKEDHARLDRIFSSHSEPAGYDLRGVTLYGIGECLRSQRYIEVLGQHDLATVGRYMRLSHDGDRLVRFDGQGRKHRFVVRTDDATLRRLARQNVDPITQCGRYACSTEAIDRLVDLANATPGVVGSQLTGAGLGGCMMVLIKAAAQERLLARLRRDFYQPRGIEPIMHVCSPVAGAGVIRL